MGRAVILGCSHAAGAEMDDEPGLNWGPGLARWRYGAENSYPVLIAQALGYTPKNHAISGGSNDAMFRIFDSQFNHSDQTDSYTTSLTQDDIVIACWTGLDRTEIWHGPDQLWVPLCPGGGRVLVREHDPVILEGRCIPKPVRDEELYQNYRQQWIALAVDTVSARLNKIKNILALNAQAQAHGIRVININSFAPVSNFKWPDTAVWPVDVDFFSWAADSGYAKTTAGHYYLPAHRAYADLILAELDR